MNRAILNPLDYADDPGELEIQRELHRLNIQNDPLPEEDRCPKCGSAGLEEASGMVGEMMLYCPAKGCNWAWEDSEDAIRRVY